MRIEVPDNHAVLAERDRLVSGTVDLFRAEFSFDESWDGFTRTAVFKAGGVRREMALVEDACKVPWEVLLPNAYLRVGVYGVNGSLVKPTTYCDHSFVWPGTEHAPAGEEPTPDVYQQWLNAVREDAVAAQEAAKAAEEVAEHVTGKEAWLYMEVGEDGCLYAVSGDALTTGFGINEDGELEVLYA